MNPFPRLLMIKPLDKGLAASVVICLFALGSWLNMARHLDDPQWDLQWDFRIYYHAAKAWQEDQNPYDAQVLSEIAQRRVSKGYAYPPATLAFFRPFTLVSYDVARHAFFALKSLLVVGLIVLWRRRFVAPGPAFYLLCLLAFNNTIYLDLRAGNVSLVEQAFLWSAFYAYMKDKLGAFCVLVLLAAAFKLVPILFLGLLLIRPSWKKLGLLAASLLGFAAFLGSSYLAQPELFHAFLNNAVETNIESKILNPSSYALCHDLIALLLGSEAAPADPALGTRLFVVLALLVAGLTVVALRRLDRVHADERGRLQIFLACFMYALVVPRFKDYSYILLIAPAAHLLCAYVRKLPASPVWIGILCVPVFNTPMPGFETFGVLLLNYYPLFVAAVLWSMYLCYARELSLTDARAADAAAAPPAPAG
jgi:hypothetical protein